MSERYIELMEKTLTAYTDDHIRDYFARVKAEGLTEHGFPRLTVNIGILIAHGRRQDLLPLFCEMMEFCCATIPRVKAANDFSVREVVCCLMEIERAQVVDAADIARWKGYLATIEPTQCYNQFATSPTQDIRNWALFTGVSEYFRQMIGLCDSAEFIDLQLASQLQFLDENGMYMDHKGTEVHQPIMYDIVPRGLFSLLLHFGYRGVHYQAIDACLRRAGRLMLDMQSACGEMAFGGRSNQFLHNEPWCAAIFEFEANRYAREGDLAMAARYKAAVAQAMELLTGWLDRTPIYHIKNRFPTETRFGCENYAYFDKYMITAASNLYAAYLMCDDSIPAAPAPDTTPVTWQSSPHFHKLFLRAGGYSAQFDTNADPQYDASGLGRIHRAGAPTAICLSVPAPAQPGYRVEPVSPIPASLCPGRKTEGAWRFGCEEGTVWTVDAHRADGESARAELTCRIDGVPLYMGCAVTDGGVTLTVTGEDEVACMLPAFDFDGECHPARSHTPGELCVNDEGYRCRYAVCGEGEIIDLGRTAANRNGYYRLFAAVGCKSVTIRVTIERA